MQFKFLLVTAMLVLLTLVYTRDAHAEVPYSPQGPHVWCLTGQAAVRLNWFASEGATSYQVRVDADAPSWNGSCTSPDSCLSTTTNEITLPITPGVQYDWWVHAVNASGWSTPAMDGVQFSCTIPMPAGLHYQCKPNDTVDLNWFNTNPASLYDVSVDADAPSWNNTCTAPDTCISTTTNMTTIEIIPGKDYEFWIQSKDTKGNKSQPSSKLAIRCSESDTVTPSQLITPTTITPTIITPLPSPTTIQMPTDEPTVSALECSKRTEGDANCDGQIDISDSECWKKVFALNFLEVSRGCKYTNFDETDGTNILDFAIWYVNREL